MKPTVSSLHDWRLDYLGAQERERIAAQELRALRWGLEEEERRRAGPPPLAPSFVGWDICREAAKALDHALSGPCPIRGCSAQRPPGRLPCDDHAYKKKIMSAREWRRETGA